ncbi:MAG: RNA-binding transcriptional accessory protein, partial [Chlorobi bacterium CHB2]|nr:RNA-binding transcriptional accessory protein [Chlorobi bacterium CHB2]
LTDELRQKIEACIKLQELEDLYLPYKPKRKTRGTIAKAKGLEPLAMFILENPDFSGDFDAKCAEFINEELGVKSGREALLGAKDIIAEMVSDSADVRKVIREYLTEQSSVVSIKASEDELETQNLKLKEKEKKEVYLIYYDFRAEINKLKPYQILAMNRGEQEGFLKISLSAEEASAHALIKRAFLTYSESVFMEILMETIADSYHRLIFPSVEREVRNVMTEAADLHAIEIFASNLRQLLLQPPFSDKTIMGIDPGYVSGCKVAVIDKTGKYIEGATIYPHEPKKKTAESEAIIIHFVKKYRVDLIAIGNGTASRETEFLVSEIIKQNSLECHYLIVNEAGASVYSASETAKNEFPDLEASQRGNISIARRVHDPLAELVKIDPKSIGVGQYQHDVDQRLLKKKLEETVEGCVNHVGVDLNLASKELLGYVAGITPSVARSIVDHRNRLGAFRNRRELLNVPRFGAKAFEQAAGFLRIRGGDEPLDNTAVHPERYAVVERMAADLNIPLPEITRVPERLKSLDLQKYITDDVGQPTLRDILAELEKPGRDPRAEFRYANFSEGVKAIADLNVGMELEGVVTNVANFGAFVDIGVHQDGLVHISQLSDRFVNDPKTVVHVGQVVKVRVLEVNEQLRRISLTMRSGQAPARSNAPRARESQPAQRPFTVDDLKAKFGKG